MDERLLSEKNLKGLVRKLGKIPIGEWTLKDESVEHHYDPYSPESMQPEGTYHDIQYTTHLRRFKVVLKFVGDYYLELKDRSGNLLDSLGESGKNTVPGRIAKIFTNIEDRYKRNEKGKEGGAKNKVLQDFKKIIS